MNSKVVVLLLTGLSIMLSMYFGITGTIELAVLLSIPLSMFLVAIHHLTLPALLKNTASYGRIKKGLDHIMLALCLALFMLHFALLLSLSGTPLNIMIFVPLIVGFIFIVTANTLPRFQLHEASENQADTNEKWNRITRPAAIPLFAGGIAILLCSLLPSPYLLTGFLIALFVTLLTASFTSYKALVFK